jgi:hypothetical protein
LKKKKNDVTDFGEASYADFVVVGGLNFLKIIDEDFYDRFVKVEPAFGKLYDASRPWLERDDH